MNNRYSRQELFRGIGPSGQQTLFQKHVLIIGAGALGSGSAEVLVRAGIGKVTLVDRDYVEWSNLQRQQLYTEQDAEERIPKAAAAQRRLKEINSTVTIEAIIEDAGVEEFEKLQKDVDLIIDATDNFDTRMIINDISQKYGIPWVYGACVGSYGISYTIIPGKTPCLHCLLESVPLGGATCDTAGIIGPAAGMVVSYQTAEALKLLVGNHGSLRTKLVTFDLWSNQHSAISPQGLKKEDCLSCGSKPSYPFLNYENQTKTAVLCGRNSVQIRPAGKDRRDLDKAANLLAKTGGKIERNPFLLSFEISGNRLVLFQDGRVLIHGVSDISEAKKIYHRYLG
ncbi:thiazole biosynthesis adenylyltransferase ThiF [Rossellomorea vietnamensis]|uniref:Thiazole biosynthesis adenylyltransferase ThiF n=1 Tax=Rossellomorea vietnamensis TaxID=218284 RepID=A0A5D4KD64_9BACI|nr:thiazole biosynthesis adenylyltransferase ThiF [Rossellomorea vietnamensis]TYR75132.1 thiazole biosynthesis adenylyltransferase ThiF [Rossellomorea vietnamensis]